MNKWIQTSALAGALGTGVLAGASAHAAETVMLNLRVQPGDRWSQHFVVDQQIQQTIMGQPMPMNQIIGMRLDNEVTQEAGEAGGRWIAVTYGRVWYTQEGPQGQVKYDSQDPPEAVPMAARGFAGLVGQQLTVQMTPDGRVTEVRGLDELTENMIQAMGLPPGPMRDGAAKALKGQMNEDSIKQMMSMATAVYPDRPVGVGDQWQDTAAIGGMTPMTIQSAFELESFDDQSAQIKVTGTIEPDPEAEPFEMNGLKMTAKLSGTQQGTATLNRETGLSTTAQMQQSMDGVMHMTPPGGQAMQIQMSIESRMTLTTLDGVEDAAAPPPPPPPAPPAGASQQAPAPDAEGGQDVVNRE